MPFRSLKIIFAALLVLSGIANAQINWQRFPGNPLALNGTPTFENTFSPSVLHDSVAGVYKMWFSSVLPGGSTWDVSYATSPNGTTWQVYSGSPVLRAGPAGSFDSRWLIDPFVIRVGSLYRMYYTGYDGSRWQTGLATSSDGINWTKHPSNPILRIVSGSTWESVGANCPKVYFGGSMYRMIYSGYNGAGYSIGLATSVDGVNFVRHEANPVLRKGTPPEWDANSALINSFLHHNGKFYLLYNGGESAPVGLATSIDGGRTWTKYPGNPVFSLGSPGSWDGYRITIGSLMVTENQFRYWYTGTGDGSRWRIGYATGIIAPPFVMSDTAAIWHFDETSGTTVRDDSPNHNNGTAIGTTITAGRFGNARTFNGSGDYVFVPNPSNGSFNMNPDQSFTIDLWFRTTSTNDGWMIRRGLAPVPGFSIGLSGRRVLAEIGNRQNGIPPDTLMMLFSNGIYNDGQWHRVTFVRDRTVRRMFLYVDGRLDATPMVDNFPIALVNDRPLTIGRWETTPEYFSGSIDEVAIYRSARHGATAPTIQVSPEIVNFGIVPVGNTGTVGLQIANLSFSDTLNVTSISSNRSVFTTTIATTRVPPWSSRVVDVRYSPTSAVADTGSLSISCNDPNRPLVRVRLSGQGFAPSAAPLVSSIRDIPEDQGKQVRVIWYRSMYDGMNDSLRIVEYNVWRRIGNSGIWDFIATVPAVRFEQYAFVAPTLFDSSRTGIRWSVFRVSAHTAGSAQVFFSASDSGYSVDNLPPLAPTNLVASVLNSRVILGWDLPTDPDIEAFAIYRSTDPNFLPSDQYRIGTTSGNSFVDQNVGGSSRFYYYVAAFDTTGNQSAPSNQANVFVTGVGSGSLTPTNFHLYQNYPNPFNPSSTIRYDLPMSGHVRISLYDVVGKEVATLVDDYRTAGSYDITVSADKLSSGVYLYRMQSGTFNAVKKMILMK